MLIRCARKVITRCPDLAGIEDTLSSNTLFRIPKSLDELADKIARVDRVALADRQVVDLSGVRRGDDHFLV